MKLSSLLKGVKTRDVYEERDVERVSDKDSDNLKNSLLALVLNQTDKVVYSQQ